jgi:CheY-like chemotaxis protein
VPNHRVLVVDDYPEAAEVMCALMRLFGHETRSATRGREAVELARTFQPDVAVVDLGLPDLNGFEVARQLRELAGGRALYIAAVSGWAEGVDRGRTLASGIDHHIQKPIDGAQARRLLALAEQKLGGRGDRTPY